MIKQVEIRKCLYSGEEFVPRRNNQVFASKKNRTNYHNKINNMLRNNLKKTNNQLLLNYKVCIDLLAKKESVTIHREFLRGKGFDYSYFTNFSRNKNSNTLIYVLYDISFQKIDENNYSISKL
jgi:hypothetical protein